MAEEITLIIKFTEELIIIGAIAIILIVTAIVINIVKWEKYNSKQKILAIVGIFAMIIISAFVFLLFYGECENMLWLYMP